MDHAARQREEIYLLDQISRTRTLMIVFVVLLVLMAAGAGICHWQIGDGKPEYTVHTIDKSAFQAYSPDVPVGTFVQAEVSAYIQGYGEEHWSETADVARPRRISTEYHHYAELLLTDGSRCMVTCKGDMDRLFGEFLRTNRINWRSEIGPLELLPPVKVYGQTRLLYPLSEQEAAELDAQGDLFLFKPQGMTDSEYYASLTSLPLIDLERTEASEQVLNEASAARLEVLARLRNGFAVAAVAALIAVGVQGFVLHRRSLQFTALIRAQRSNA